MPAERPLPVSAATTGHVSRNRAKEPENPWKRGEGSRGLGGKADETIPKEKGKQDIQNSDSEGALGAQSPGYGEGLEHGGQRVRLGDSRVRGEEEVTWEAGRKGKKEENEGSFCKQEQDASTLSLQPIHERHCTGQHWAHQ